MLEMTKPQMSEFLDRARIGRLCMAALDGQPYAIPMPFCWHQGWGECASRSPTRP